MKFSFAFLLLFLGFYSKSLWENQSTFRDYLTFNQARHSVIDHPVFYNLAEENHYAKDPKWKHFSHWFIQKADVSLVDLYEYREFLNTRLYTLNQLSISIKRLLQVHLMELFKSFLAGLFLLLFWVHFRKDKKMWFILIGWLIFLLIFNHFNHLRGRVIFLFYMPILASIFPRNIKWRGVFRPHYLFPVLGILFFIHFQNFLKEANKRKEYLSQFETLWKTNKDEGILYLEGFPYEYFSKSYTLSDPIPFFLEGWVARSPFQQKAYKRLGFSDLGEFDRYFLIGIEEKGPFDFPDYINSFGKKFKLHSEKKTMDLIRFEYLEKSD